MAICKNKYQKNRDFNYVHTPIVVGFVLACGSENHLHI
jgi:hypothetical protein